MQKKRRSISKKACENCRKAHSCCSDQRPCVRCLANSLDCMDMPSKKRGRKRKNSQVEESGKQKLSTPPFVVTPSSNNNLVIPQQSTLFFANDDYRYPQESSNSYQYQYPNLPFELRVDLNHLDEQRQHHMMQDPSLHFPHRDMCWCNHSSTDRCIHSGQHWWSSGVC